MSQPSINLPHEGHHNANWDKELKRISNSKIFEDLSTVIITPTRSHLHVRHVCAMTGLIRPFNHKIFGPIYPRGFEVGDAYNSAIQQVLDNPQLRDFKYILTIEDDMLPPLDGMLRLYRNIGDYDMIGGLYWTKGENGLPLMFGDVSRDENYIPVLPITNSVMPVYGSGMGFNLWKMDMFKQMENPWFETIAKMEGDTAVTMTQDINFFKKANKLGFKFAIDTSCKCGHLDSGTEIVW